MTKSISIPDAQAEQILNQLWACIEQALLAPVISHDIVTGKRMIMFDSDNKIHDLFWRSLNSISRSFNTRHPFQPRIALSHRCVRCSATDTGFRATHNITVKFLPSRAETDSVAGILLSHIASNLPKEVSATRYDLGQGPCLHIAESAQSVNCWVSVAPNLELAISASQTIQDPIYLGSIESAEPDLLSRRVNRMLAILSSDHTFFSEYIRKEIAS